MKTILILAVLISISCVLSDFGIKSGDTWIECNDENTNCADSNHTASANSVCVRRVLKSVLDVNDADYIAAKASDSALGTSNIDTIVSRCMSTTEKDTWLTRNNVLDAPTGITASYSYVPYIPPASSTTTET